ncbi:hypothetical protein Tco_1192318 [Tanacetum coccineum]
MSSKCTQQIRARIEKQNQKYKKRVDSHRKRVVFKEGDLVWIRLGKERFPMGRFGKLQPRADDLIQYVTDSEDDEDEENHNVEQDSRANLFQAREYGAQ